MSQVSVTYFAHWHMLNLKTERTPTLQRQLRMSTITNQGRPLWSQGTGLMT